MMDVKEKICIQAYQSQWIFDFEQERAKIINSMGNNKFYIEHIGSTSVEGMYAKPIIDILMGVESFPPCDKFIESVIKIDYEFMKEASVSDRLYFVKRNILSFNLHIVKYDGNIWNDDILFRDFLRNNPNAVREYSKLKKNIVDKGINLLLEYSDEKAPYILKLLEKIR